jgi:mannose-1-phosphate guanylyltransferase/mannose-6-phosphate isomerase
MRLLLLAGGSGTRLWPLSTEERPKQFLPLLSEKSLLAETYARVAPLSSDVWVATAARHEDLVRRELPQVPRERILVEPSRRNSGPALLAAALRFTRDGDPITAALPSDQTATDAGAFRSALERAGAEAESASVVVLGVPPTRPETDFGYLELGEPVPGGASSPVRRFVEKPDGARARSLVAAGDLWNAGIFVFRPSRLLAEARRVAGDLVSGIEAFLAAERSGDAARAAQAWDALPSISIDFAVMEKAAGIRAVPLRAGWSDVGSWRAVRDLRGGGDGGNLVLSDRPVIAPGVVETAIVATDRGVLVLPFDREAGLRDAVERLGREEAPSAGRWEEKRR